MGDSYGSVSQDVELLPSAARTASVNGETKGIEAGKRTATAYLDVTAITGTSTLDVKIQDSVDNGTTWVDIDGGSFAQVTTSTGQEYITVLIRRAANAIRAVATLGASPNFTFSVDAVVRS